VENIYQNRPILMTDFKEKIFAIFVFQNHLAELEALKKFLFMGFEAKKSALSISSI
jgi:hypothetical protein